MSKVAVVFWSGTGNTQAMAEAVAAGAKDKGADVSVIEAGSFNADMAADYEGIAFGCPAMGDEVLEEDEFDPMFTAVEGSLAGKKVGLRCSNAGITLAADSVTANDAPDDDAVAACIELGAALA